MSETDDNTQPASTPEDSSPTATQTPDTQTSDSAPAEETVPDRRGHTLYRHDGKGTVDTSVWPVSDYNDGEGNSLHYFAEDKTAEDMNGVSDDWVVSTDLVPRTDLPLRDFNA